MYLPIYLSAYYLPTRAQILAPALVLLPVLLPVPLAAVRRHLAPSTQDVDICSFLATRPVADPSQLLAKALVLGHVLHGVRHAAVQRHSASGTLEQDRAVPRLDRARRVLALPDFPLFILRVIDGVGDHVL